MERLVWGRGPSWSQTAKNSRSFLLRDVTIRLHPSASWKWHASTRPDKRFRMIRMAELIYLSSVCFDRKSRARSTTPTSLIIERSRHPFHEKTDALPMLMGALEMMQIIISMESRGVATGRLILLFTSSSRSAFVEVRSFDAVAQQCFGKGRRRKG